MPRLLSTWPAGVRRYTALHHEAPVRLRFAPSPTGYLHLGGLRTALFNHLLARKLGGAWILRIEDTDQNRFVDGATQSLINTLQWAGLDYDEGPDKPGSCGPYVQSHRRQIYDKYTEQLLETGHAYRCFCKPERLTEMRSRLQKQGSTASYDRKCLHTSSTEVDSRLRNGESFVVRLLSPDTSVVHHDLIYGDVKFPNNSHDDAILVKADGMPTYHFANVVDDHTMGISHVLRGEEWLTSTAKHLNVYAALGLVPPLFGHMPLLVNADGSKLSKRSGDVRVEDFIKQGYEPEALLNHVALVGLNHLSRSLDKDGPEADNCELMNMQQLVETFAIEHVNKTRSTLNPSKLVFLNRHHLARKLSENNQIKTDLIDRAESIIQAKVGLNEWSTSKIYVEQVLQLLRERIHVLQDLNNLSSYFFQEPDYNTEQATTMKSNCDPELFSSAINETITALTTDCHEFTHGTIRHALSNVTQSVPTVKGKVLMTPVRYAITGCKVGAGLIDTMVLVGRERTLQRLKRCKEH